MTGRGTPSTRRRRTRAAKRPPQRKQRHLLLEPLEDRVLLDAAGWTPEDGGVSMETPTGLEEIRGVVWNDLDGNGIHGTDEPIMPAAEVYLDLNQNGVRDEVAEPWDGLPADGLEPAAVTDQHGSYVFTGLPPGEYPVAAVVPDGWEMTPTRAVSGGMQWAGVPGIRSDGPDLPEHGMRSSISADGRYVVYDNLITSGTDDVGQIYLFDRDTGQTEMLSIGLDGNPANRHSENPSISADGRYVVYNSYATNLIDGDTNMEKDLFLYDRGTGTTQRISVADDGSEANESSWEPSISADGRYIAFTTRATNLIAGRSIGSWDPHVYVHDRVTGTNEWLSEAYDGTQLDEWVRSPQISADGRYVAFWSLAPNLVPDDTNNVEDVFVHDRQLGTTRRVSVATDGTQGDEGSMSPAISDDGKYLAFVSYASNLDPANPGPDNTIYVHELATGVTESILLTDSDHNGFIGYDPSISGDGRYLAVLVDYGILGIYDRVTELFEKVPGAPDGSRSMGRSFRPVISADGKVVAFSSNATNLAEGNLFEVNLFVADATRTWLPGTQLVSLAAGESRLGIDFGIRMADPVLPPDVPVTDEPVGNNHWRFYGPGSYVGADAPVLGSSDSTTVTFLDGATVKIDSDAGTIRIVGTEGDDSVEFIAANTLAIGTNPAPQLSHVLVVNGIGSEFDPNEIHTILISEVENVTMTANDGDDTLVSTSDNLTLDGEAYSVVATGADSVHVDGLGGKNAASLHDSTGNDVFTGGPASSTIEYASGNTVQVDRFGFVHAYGKQGGNDTASLHDSDRNDLFKGTPTYGKFIYESQTLVRAKFFDIVHAYSKAGGQDVAHLDDSAGDDTFVAKPTFSKMKFDGGSFTRAKFFHIVHAFAKAGGHDIAQIIGTTGDDLFHGSPTRSKLEFANQTTVRARCFESVFANAGRGGQDDAFLTDSASIDHLVADGNQVSLTTTVKGYGKIGQLLTNFGHVKATASTPGDVARVGQLRSGELDLELTGPWKNEPGMILRPLIW